MHIKFGMLTLAALPLALAAGQATAQDAAKTGMKGKAAPAGAADKTGAPAYMKKAASSDQYEICSSELALSRSRNAHVREVAQMMIRDHKKTTATLTAAARRAGMTPPPPTDMMPSHRAMLDALKGQTGAGFDRTYLTQQRKAHEEALALHSGYAARGDTPALREAAKAAVPIIENHRKHLAAH